MLNIPNVTRFLLWRNNTCENTCCGTGKAHLTVVALWRARNACSTEEEDRQDEELVNYSVGASYFGSGSQFTKTAGDALSVWCLFSQCDPTSYCEIQTWVTYAPESKQKFDECIYILIYFELESWCTCSIMSTAGEIKLHTISVPLR